MNFVYFHEPEDDPHIEGLRFRNLGEGGFWVMHAVLLPDFLEPGFEMTAPRKPKG